MENKQGELDIPKATLTLTDPQGLARFATTLKKFIIEQKLYTPIVGKNYVNVEGWQFAGGMLGVLPFLTSCVKLDRENEIAYEAHVELRNLSGQVIGSAMAVCSNKESRKKTFDEYAIASMSQTRAIGKAYRSSFGWLMKMAGYESTPAEEVDSDFITVNGKQVPKPGKETTQPTPTKDSIAGNIMEKIGGEDENTK